ncbi:adenosylmethionine decarboxylase [Parashewanella curva]|uniref:Adenosylmethionine decarboxylase n=1 Tax=Parashewanella curva TaxID=2338552 RepID=A0A3L8PW85_9GAMM|nr:adenosylmethionine decarboxylase [Parashewanella curva]RLV58883.1 adenosylmethionine decarboxylase [Parashewanella curva]
MFFEGSEKKVEVVMTSSSDSLRSLDKVFWEKLVSLSNAEILSSVHNEQCDAYLLSESSLFVWHDRFLMMTCGNSTLVNSLLSFIEKVGVVNIQSIKYQRNKEYLGYLQTSSFTEDIEQLKQIVDGKAYRIGHLDMHHHHVFYYGNGLVEDSISSELLMYHISGNAAAYLRSDSQKKADIRTLLQLDTLFPDFAIDDHLFEPLGYSINGLKKDKYFTIHITPQESSSYVSLETNLDINAYQSGLFIRLLDILKPGSWDTISMNTQVEKQALVDSYCIGSCELFLNQGKEIAVKQYQQPWHKHLFAEQI